MLNLNVPALPYDEVGGVRWARLAAFGAVRAAVADAPDGRRQFELRSTNVPPAPDTDTGIVAAGFAALTTIVGIAEAWPADLHDDVDLREGVVPGHAARRGGQDPRRFAPPLAAPPACRRTSTSCDLRHAGFSRVELEDGHRLGDPGEPAICRCRAASIVRPAPAAAGATSSLTNTMPDSATCTNRAASTTGSP